MAWGELTSITLTLRSATKVSVALERAPDSGATLLRAFQWHEPGTGAEPVVLDPAAADALLAQARALVLPIGPQTAVVGFDGATYKLELTAGSHSANVTWWREPPRGWEPAGDLAAALLRAAAPWLVPPLVREW